MKAGKLIIEGQYFIPTKFKPKLLESLKKRITEFMLLRGFQRKDPLSSLFENRFLSMKFTLDISIKGKKRLLESEDKYAERVYFKRLKNTRNDLPFEISIMIRYIKYEGKEGLLLIIRSKPVLLQKILQGIWSNEITEELYSYVTETNKQFIEEVATAIGGMPVKEPQPIEGYKKTFTIETLEKLGLEETAKLLKNGRSKLHLHPEDALTDLRESIRKFFIELLSQTEISPDRKPMKNIELLHRMEIINNFSYKRIKGLFEPVYHFLSNKAVHERKRIGLLDAEFLFDLCELGMIYLVNKVLIYRIK